MLVIVSLVLPHIFMCLHIAYVSLVSDLTVRHNSSTTRHTLVWLDDCQPVTRSSIAIRIIVIAWQSSDTYKAELSRPPGFPPGPKPSPRRIEL